MIIRGVQVAKMLVFLPSREERLITFSLPNESCTLEEVLSQVNISFTPNTPIQVMQNIHDDIDYFVSLDHTIGIQQLLKNHPLFRDDVSSVNSTEAQSSKTPNEKSQAPANDCKQDFMHNVQKLNHTVDETLNRQMELNVTLQNLSKVLIQTNERLVKIETGLQNQESSFEKFKNKIEISLQHQENYFENFKNNIESSLQQHETNLEKLKKKLEFCELKFNRMKCVARNRIIKKKKEKLQNLKKELLQLEMKKQRSRRVNIKKEIEKLKLKN